MLLYCCSWSAPLTVRSERKCLHYIHILTPLPNQSLQVVVPFTESKALYMASCPEATAMIKPEPTNKLPELLESCKSLRTLECTQGNPTFAVSLIAQCLD